MSEIPDILNQSDPLPIRELCKYFHDKHTSVILKNQDAKSFFKEIFSFFSKRPVRYTENDWDHLRLIAYIFAIAFDPPADSISVQFPLVSRNGSLVATTLVLLSMQMKQPNSPDLIDTIHKYYYDKIISFFPKYNRSSFYMISPCYYFLAISSILEDQIFSSPFIDDFPLIFKKITEITPEQLTFSMITFIAEIYKIVKASIMNKIQIKIPDEFIDSFLHILDLSSESPAIFLSNFFHSWFFLVKQCKDMFRTDALCKRISTITILFEKTAICKYHEIHRSFPWYLIFYFYDYIQPEDHIQRVQLLSMICNGIRRVNRMDSFQRIIESVKMFSRSIEQQYAKKNPYYMFYMMSSLDSSLGALIFQLMKIHSVDKIGVKEGPRIKRRQVSFHEQANWSPNSPALDDFLYTNAYEHSFADIQACVADFEHQFKVCDNIRQCFHSLVIFQVQIAIRMRKSLSFDGGQQIPSNDTSNPFFYLLKIFTTLINFMVSSSYKQMEIQSFAIKEILVGATVSPQCAPYAQNPQRLLEFTIIFTKYSEILVKFPPQFINTLALIVANNLFTFMEKGILTYNFILNFSIMQKDYNNPKSLSALLLSRMMEIASNKISLLMSFDINDANLIYSWIAFTIRLATPPNGSPNHLFGCTLKLYQRLLFYSVFTNMRAIPHQSIAIRLVSHYLAAVKDNYKVVDDIKDKQKPVRTRPVVLEEIEVTANVDTLGVILEICLNEPDFMTEQALLPLVDAAFKCSDNRVISKAAQICLNVFTVERATQNPVTCHPELEESIFKAFVNAIGVVDNETAIKISALLPYYSSKFLRAMLKKPEPQLFQADSTKIDMYLSIKAISEHVTNSEEEATHMFALINVCFESVIENVVMYSDIIQPSLKLLINLLKHCCGFEHLKDPTAKFLSYITRAFGDMFIRGESNTYIICLFDVMGINRSDSTATVMKFGVSFFEYCKGKSINPAFLAQTVDTLFSSFPILTRIFSIISSFSLMIRYYPQFITLNHIRIFLIQTSDIHPLDKAFSTMLNMFLKRFFAKSDRQTQSGFVSMVYEIICPLSIAVRNVLEKRLSKLGIKLQIASLDQIAKTQDQILMFQQLTLAFLCGIEGSMESNLSPEWISRTIQFFKPNQNESIHRLQKFARILSLCTAILKNHTVFKYFSANIDFFNNLIRFLCNSMMSHFNPVRVIAKKCFRILKNVYYTDLMAMKQIDEFWKNPMKMFSFWGPQPDRIAFYTCLTKLLPEKTPPDVVKDFFNQMSAYIEKSDVEKMTLIMNFSRILKQFAVSQYVMLESVKSIITNNNNGTTQSYIEIYIENILALYRSTTIPFKAIIFKSVLRFLVLFAQQTTNYLIRQCTDPTHFNFVFLKDLIAGDETDEFFKCFLGFFEVSHNFALLSPALYEVFEKISVIERFAKESELPRVLLMEFSQVINSCTDPNRRDENGLAILTSLSTSIINTARYNIDYKQVISVASVFRLSFFHNSDVFHKYVSIIFNPQSSQQTMLYILRGSLKSIYKLPPSMAIILVPHSIKVLLSIPNQNAETIWDQLIISLTFPAQVATVLKSMRFMLDKAVPRKDQMIKILDSLKLHLESAETQIVVYSLKLCTKLAELKYIPQVIFEATIQQLFSYPKFFEAPYMTYFLNFIKACPEYVKRLSPKVIETISFFFYDKFLNSKEIQKSSTLIIVMTRIYEVLPFSFFTALSTFILKKMKNAKPEDLSEIREILLFTIPLYTQSNPDENEKNIFFRVGFKFVKMLLLSPNQLQNQHANPAKDFNDVFFNYVLESKVDEIPIELIDAIGGSVQNATGFCLICLAVRTIPTKIYQNYPELVDSALHYIEKAQNFISNSLLHELMKFVFSNKSVFLKFKATIWALITALMKEISIPTFDRLKIISNAVISSHFDSDYNKVKFHIWSIYSSMESNSLSNSLFKMLLKFAEIVPFQDQCNYIDYIITQTKWTTLTRKTLTLTIPSLMMSETLMNSAKAKLLYIFPTHICGTEIELLKIIESVKKFGEMSGTDVVGTLILLYIFIADEVISPSARFLCFDKIDELLIKTGGFKERLHLFMEILPMILWTDEYFIYVVAMLIEKTKFWCPLFAFSPRIKGIASNVIIPTLFSKIDRDISADLRTFLTRILKADSKSSFSQILITIEKTFIQSSKNIPYNLFARIFNVSPDTMALSSNRGFFTFDDYCLSRLVFPDVYNDALIREVMPAHNDRQISAIFLTYLGKYDVAEKLYRYEKGNENSYFNQLRTFNSHFVTHNEMNFDLMITPLLKLDNRAESVIVNLQKAVDSFLNGKNEESLEFLKAMKDEAIESYLPHKSPSVYQKERFVVLNILYFMVDSKIKNEKLPKFSENPVFSCINPSFIKMLSNFKRLLNKKGEKPALIIDASSPPSILIPPSIYSKFKSVAGVSSHGFFALSSSQIDAFFQNMSDKILSQNFSINNWIVFAPFCFNVFIAQQTRECFSTAFGAYCQIVSSKENGLSIVKSEASARLVTLIRIAVHQDPRDGFKDPIIASSFIFKKGYAEIWRVWLQQLVEIANDKWFFTIAIELFTEMAYRSTLYASKYASRDVQDALHNAIVNEHSFVQISMMNKIESALNKLRIDHLVEIEKQRKIQTFIDEAFRLSEEELDTINLIETRKRRYYVTPFEVALSALTQIDIEKVGNIKERITEMKMMSQVEREKVIQEITESSDTLSVLNAELFETVEEFNGHMPFIFPIRIDANIEFSLFVMHKRCTFLSPEIATFAATTSFESNQHFLVMRSNNPNGFHASVMSLSNMFTLIRIILRNSYPTMMRSISLADNFCFEIGANTLLKGLDSEPYSLKFLFEKEMMITQEDWIERCIDKTTGKLNEDGEESIKTFPVDSLARFDIQTTTDRSHIFIHAGLAMSYASTSLIRHLLSCPYMDMNRMITCGKSLEFPILSIDFDTGNFTAEQESSTFRFSPTIEHVCGVWGDCGLKMAIAAVSNALTENLEMLRTHLEIILGDELTKDNFSLKEILRQRTIVENRFISLTPPSNENCTDEEAMEWLTKIENLVERAKNPWIQPATAIPWF